MDRQEALRSLDRLYDLANEVVQDSPTLLSDLHAEYRSLQAVINKHFDGSKAAWISDTRPTVGEVYAQLKGK